jgi:hypothetical protein
MVEIFINYFSLVSNDRLADRYIKWNNNNYSRVILNVDESCLGSPVRSGFGGIIRNTFRHYLAGFSSFIPETSDILFVELYAICKGLLLASCMNIIFLLSLPIESGSEDSLISVCTMLK